MPRPKTKTATQSVAEYKRRNYDTIKILVKHESKELLRQRADEQGVSLSRYILEAVEARSGLHLTLDNPLPWMNPGIKK